MVSILVALLTLHQAFAGPYFTTLRDDQTIPEYCQEMELDFYSLPVEKFYVGRAGALNMGYTFEYPVTRSNATVLWRYFKSLTHGDENLDLLEKIKRSADLKRDYEIILRNYKEQDFFFESEGEILEVLAIQLLYQEFPENTYYISGGFEYHESYSPKTIGELDLYVGRRDNCEAVAIGEAKLGRRNMLNKARRQLARFENFLVDHNVGSVPVAK